MKSLNCWLQRLVIFLIVMVLVVPFGTAETGLGLQSTETGIPAPTGQNQTPAATPGASSTVAGAQTVPATTLPESPAGVPGQSQQNPAPQTNQTKPDNSPTGPVGTAAAPYEKQEGISASKPAGAAIAPGKQRRIRTYAIRVGLIVGAAIAIGVVTAASLGSSSRP